MKKRLIVNKLTTKVSETDGIVKRKEVVKGEKRSIRCIILTKNLHNNIIII